MGSVVAESVLGVIENMDNLIQVTSYFKFNLIKSDPDDNKFVDCAIAANADFILTEDKHFLRLRSLSFPKVEIINISEFKSMNKGW